MTDSLNGAARLHFIVGDPIAQVKSPAGMSQAFHDQGRNALCVPAHCGPLRPAFRWRAPGLSHPPDLHLIYT